MLLKFVGFSYVLVLVFFLFEKKHSLNTKFMFCLFCKMYGRDSIKLLRFSFNKLVIFARLPKRPSFFLKLQLFTNLMSNFHLCVCMCVFLIPFILIFFVLKFVKKKILLIFFFFYILDHQLLFFIFVFLSFENKVYLIMDKILSHNFLSSNVFFFFNASFFTYFLHLIF